MQRPPHEEIRELYRQSPDGNLIDNALKYGQNAHLHIDDDDSAFVLHVDDEAAGAAESATHVHHVAADPAALPGEWTRRFDLVVAIETAPAPELVAGAGLLFTIAEQSTVAPDGLAEVLRQRVEDPARPGVERERAVFARLAPTA